MFRLDIFVVKTCYPVYFQLFVTRARLTTNLRRLINNGPDSPSSPKNDDYDSSAPQVPHEIYKGMLTSQVKAVKTFSLGTSLIGIGMQPMLYEVSRFHITMFLS